MNELNESFTHETKYPHYPVLTIRKAPRQTACLQDQNNIFDIKLDSEYDDDRVVKLIQVTLFSTAEQQILLKTQSFFKLFPGAGP